MGLVRRTVSPCSSSMRRSTPCVDGCCGPMLMIIVSSSPGSVELNSAASVSERRSTAPISRSSSSALLPLRGASSWRPSYVSAASPPRTSSRSPVVVSAGILDPLELHGDAADRVVLAQRVAEPVLRHEDAGEIGMAVEADPEHVVRLALHGLGAGV